MTQNRSEHADPAPNQQLHLLQPVQNAQHDAYSTNWNSSHAPMQQPTVPLGNAAKSTFISGITPNNQHLHSPEDPQISWPSHRNAGNTAPPNSSQKDRHPDKSILIKGQAKRAHKEVTKKSQRTGKTPRHSSLPALQPSGKAKKKPKKNPKGSPERTGNGSKTQAFNLSTHQPNVTSFPDRSGKMRCFALA